MAGYERGEDLPADRSARASEEAEAFLPTKLQRSVVAQEGEEIEGRISFLLWTRIGIFTLV